MIIALALIVTSFSEQAGRHTATPLVRQPRRPSQVNEVIEIYKRYVASHLSGMEKTVPSARVYLDFGVAWRNTLKSAILVISDAGSFAALARGVK